MTSGKGREVSRRSIHDLRQGSGRRSGLAARRRGASGALLGGDGRPPVAAAVAGVEGGELLLGLLVPVEELPGRLHLVVLVTEEREGAGGEVDPLLLLLALGLAELG